MEQATSILKAKKLEMLSAQKVVQRRGPRPLSLHLMTALSVWLSSPTAPLNLKNTWKSSNRGSITSNPKSAGQLEKLRAVQNLANPEFDLALRREAIRRARRFIAGIKAYQNHSDHRDVLEAPVIWSDGTTYLRDYNPFQKEAQVILVIPSLINRFEILDLDFVPSFLRTLAARGFRPLVVDWNTPSEKEKDFDLNDYVLKRLMPIKDFLAEQQIRSFHLLGYCMGGLLALALATLCQKEVKTLSLLATPWDFHQPDPTAGQSFLALADQMEPCFDTLGFLPVDVIQGLFSALQPLQVLTKFIEFGELDPASSEARQFVLLEDWLNDGVPLTARVAKTCLRDWYGHNVTAALKWTVADKIIDPRALNFPSYVIVPGKDRIVPPESARPLARLLPHATLHEPMMGHIGMIASRTAPHQVWTPLFHWLDEHI